MSLEGSVLRLYNKYSWGGGSSRSQRSERRAFLWQVRLAEEKIEGPSAPYVWIGTAYSTLLLVVTTFLLTYKFTTVLPLLIHILQTTTYTIITEDSDGAFQSVSLRDLKAMGVDIFVASQDSTKPPWDDCPYYLWVYTGVLPHYVFQVTARDDHPIRSMMNPAGRLQYTRRLLQDILDVAFTYCRF